MTGWYADYFTADYWSFARHEYTAARTAHEAAYIRATLAEHAPGRRVLDLGCGIGRHAVELARDGYEVTGVDVCRWALDEAAKAAAEEGVPLGLIHADLLRRTDLPEADAAVCVQAFGWGRDDEQLAFLRQVRDRLAPGGILILDHSNVAGILANYQPTARFEAEGTVFDFHRAYDVLSGRSRGELRVGYPDGRVAELRDDVRLYLPNEVAALLEAAGFDILRADADFRAGSPVLPTTRYVQFVAVAAPRRELAVLRHGDAQGQVDLRWAPDEVEYVRDAVDRAWHEAGSSETARRYALDDPYGGARSAPVLGRHFGVELAPDQVVTGAGVSGLLHALGALGGPVAAAAHAHPDLPAWASNRGVRVHDFDPWEEPVARPGLVLVDRPGVRGGVLPLERVAALAETAHAAGGVLVVDESCAAYLGPSASAVPLVSQVPGLVVLRGVSKGYCCGGLRAGFAISSPDVAGQVRAAVAPLGVSAVSLDVALGLIGQGDVLAPLRAAVAAAKPGFVAALTGLGLRVEPGHPALPWVVTEDEPPPWLLARRLPGLNRLSVPLSEARRAAFLEAA